MYLHHAWCMYVLEKEIGPMQETEELLQWVTMPLLIFARKITECWTAVVGSRRQYWISQGQENHGSYGVLYCYFHRSFLLSVFDDHAPSPRPSFLNFQERSLNRWLSLRLMLSKSVSVTLQLQPCNCCKWFQVLHSAINWCVFNSCWPNHRFAHWLLCIQFQPFSFNIIS